MPENQMPRIPLPELQHGDRVEVRRIPLHPVSDEEQPDKSDVYAVGRVIKLPDHTVSRGLDTYVWVQRDENNTPLIIPTHDYTDRGLFDTETQSRHNFVSLKCRMAFFAITSEAVQPSESANQSDA